VAFQEAFYGHQHAISYAKLNFILGGHMLVLSWVCQVGLVCSNFETFKICHITGPIIWYRYIYLVLCLWQLSCGWPGAPPGHPHDSCCRSGERVFIKAYL